MFNLWSYLLSLLILILVIIPGIIIIWKMSKKTRNNVWQFFRYSRKHSPYSTSRQGRMGDRYLFAPHPFTNWSLNPDFRNEKGDCVHTVEGFRKTQKDDSILQLVRDNPNAYKIVCIGGSTTHCAEMEYYQDTWPAKLKEKLSSKKDVLVLNFGVGAWGTLHSLIRCVTWLPIIKPNLLVFYQAKNDLTPFANAAEKEKTLYPDYQNVMGQFSESFVSYFPKWLNYIPFFFLYFYIFEFSLLQKNYGLLSIYRPKPWMNPKGFERLTEEHRNCILFRSKTIFNICASLECQVLYIPEIVRSGEYVDALDSLYSEIYKIAKEFDHVNWFNIKKVYPDLDRYFLDKMHFSKEGCDLFAELLARHIQ